MALSFNDLLDSAKGDFFEDVPPMIATTSGDDAVLAYEDSWEFDKKYAYYEDYNDESFSTIDAYKNIHLDSSQVNLTQEENSQFIPFEMPRYYDGFDLSTTTLLIHFVNRDGYEDFDSPVNVSYSYEKIRFGWLVDSRVTAVDGIVRFEIQAIGKNSAGEEYIWKTLPYGDLKIIKSLSGEGIIEPDFSWINSFIERITNEVSQNVDIVIPVDDTLSIVGAAADAKATGDAINSLPVYISKDGYTEIENTRKATSGAFTKEENAIKAVFTMSGGKTSTSIITINDAGYPSKINTDGYVCDLSFSGFELTENEAANILDEINGEIIE